MNLLEHPFKRLFQHGMYYMDLATTRLNLLLTGLSLYKLLRAYLDGDSPLLW
jgi:hypothetical protein